MARVGLIFGGRSVEHEVSVRSARTVASGLVEAGHVVIPLGIGAGGRWVDLAAGQAALAGEVDRLVGGEGGILDSLDHLRRADPEVLFPIVHGTWGEDGTLQGFCEILDLPFAGAGVTASALAMDKILCKRQLESAGVPVVEYASTDRRTFESDPASFLAEAARLPFPLFVKPSVGGSSVGVRRVESENCLETSVRFAFGFGDTVLVERGIAGRELECAVLGYERLQASAVGEVVPGKDFYDYEDKYLSDEAELHAPADLPPEIETAIRGLATAAFGAIGGDGMARVDFLLAAEPEAGTGLYVNEINTLPGFTSISMYPRLWALEGVELPELVDRLVEIAQRRHRDRTRLDSGIKKFLAELEESDG